MKGFKEAGIEDPLIERAAQSINTNPPPLRERGG
jgi:hypothetical protein